MRDWRRQLSLIALLALAVYIGVRGQTIDPGATPVPTAEPTLVAEAPTTVPTSVPTDPPIAEPTATTAPTEEPTLPPTEEPTATEAPTATVVQQEESADAPMNMERPIVPDNTSGSAMIYERGEPGLMEVALTFDAGEGVGPTAEILDFLKERNIRASFGITGVWAQEYPDLVSRMVNEGHMLFNHSYSHRDWTGDSAGTGLLPDADRLAEVQQGEQAIIDVTGYDPKPFWRPPYGEIDQAGLELLDQNGYGYVLWWSCDSLGWSGATPQEIVDRCGPDAEGGGDGAIILMHVSQQADYDSLDALVTAYESAGYRFVTMEQMVADSQANSTHMLPPEDRLRCRSDMA